MVPAGSWHLGEPSVRAYQKGCRCRPCTTLNTAACLEYRAKRKAAGAPLKPTGKMPSLMTRLRREIGYMAAKEDRG